MRRPGWEHFHHQADIGVRGLGRSAAEAFQQAALAMTSVITDLDRIGPENPVQITCEAADMEMLLFEWLNTLIYEMAARNMLFRRFDVTIDENRSRLTATAFGEPLDVEKHQPTVEVKGATLHQLKARPIENGLYLAQCVVDV